MNVTSWELLDLMEKSPELVFAAYFKRPIMGMCLLKAMIDLKYIDPYTYKWVDTNGPHKSILICILHEAEEIGLFRHPLKPETTLSISKQIFGVDISDITRKTANKHHGINFEKVRVSARLCGWDNTD